MGESQYSRQFRSKIPKMRISKIHQKWSKLCSGEWNGTRKWCFGSCCTFVFDAFNQHLNRVKKMQVLVRKSVSKCHRSSLFPTFSSLINKTHGRCQESRLFHSQRFCFHVSFHSETLETRVSYLTTKQNIISPENGAFQTKIVFWNKLNSDWTLLERIFTSGFHLRTWCSCNTRSVVEP